jgi:hypothetical protein
MNPISPKANLDGAAERGEDSERGRVADDSLAQKYTGQYGERRRRRVDS